MRYALYFSPAPDSPWWQAGASWLGRDPMHAGKIQQGHIPGVPDILLSGLTAEARRYGFHATLKAPFNLLEGFHEADLISMANAFARLQPVISISELQIRMMGDFLALRPHGNEAEINALAMRCVSFFDMLRSAPDAAYLAKRRHAGLSARQESLLQQWGYPYTEEEYRFHLTLSDDLSDTDADLHYALRKAAEHQFGKLMEVAPLAIDALTIFREERPGLPFNFWMRFPFQAKFQQKTLPASGRLFFVVGPSGAGKDTLLQWVRDNLPANAELDFAQRTITRPAHDSEGHEALSQEAYWQAAAAGHFCMQWQANGLCYGIRRHIEVKLKCGHDVIVNGSREYLPQLKQLFPDAKIIWIMADPEQIRQRMEKRQRESGAALLNRIDRGLKFSVPEDQNIICIDNSGAIHIAGQKLLKILTQD
ncbi:phosphonate metabolism protein/1,5-bisphosphokinase (PRPP-forming) PhnN [Undibacterium sp. TS12]|uniref:phosphonate metabolism protein/1,5-bisphosphokinase (PRPP-forming) PhnN n=1 Tax=Undibacterium sp. TS12 TaxID=2908202 RepID=UPI001F4CD2BD|nr:phosphonate metabolism protein/1,5-bisphosphokinase (PRPP-forming) PhnN [Undibacterium sp. TS12]MCH8617820.1 phosphonate metabolism protein/1,5-bisphosphokinase (PRPP-forming) PhnN [Undibacterium sp. TS12]